jgi:hypothetical protein
MPGYSGTPLPKKLGIKPSFRIAFLNLPAEVKAELREDIAACELVKNGQGRLDFVHIFVKSQTELKKEFKNFSKQLAPTGMLWISWPKKSSGVATDLDGNKVRDIGLETGLVDVKVCAVTDVWSGLKFVIRVKDRARRA